MLLFSRHYCRMLLKNHFFAATGELDKSVTSGVKCLQDDVKQKLLKTVDFFRGVIQK